MLEETVELLYHTGHLWKKLFNFVLMQ